MEDFIKNLTSIRKLRLIARDISIGVLEDSLLKLTKVVEERRAEIKANETARLEHDKNIKEIAKKILDMGVNIDDVVSALATTPKASRPKRPAKYEYIDFDGTVKQWTGQGRTPSVIQTELDKGKALSDFLIK